MAVAVAYDQHGVYDCSKCSLSRSIENQCTRLLDRDHPDWEDDPHVTQHTKHWSTPADPEYREETCWRFQVRDESWQIVEDARLLARHSILFHGGGTADQPVWWWQRVQVVLDLVRRIEHTRDNAPESLDAVVKQFQEHVQSGLTSGSTGRKS